MKKILLSVVALTILSANVLAENPDRYYLGLAYGQGDYSADGPSGAVIFLPGQNFRGSDPVVGIYGGYRFFDYLAVELNYSDHGSARDRYTINPDIAFIVSPNDRQRIESESLSVSALLSYPIAQLGAARQLRIFSSLGISQVKSEIGVYGGFSPSLPSLNRSDSERDQGYNYGLGLIAELTESLDLRVQWQRTDIDNLELSNTSLGLQFSF